MFGYYEYETPQEIQERIREEEFKRKFREKKRIEDYLIIM